MGKQKQKKAKIDHFRDVFCLVFSGVLLKLPQSEVGLLVLVIKLTCDGAVTSEMERSKGFKEEEAQTATYLLLC